MSSKGQAHTRVAVPAPERDHAQTDIAAKQPLSVR
jgi:hypothetical protein